MIISVLSILCILVLVSWVTHSFMPRPRLFSPLSSSSELLSQNVKFPQDGKQQFGIEKTSLAQISYFNFVSKWHLDCCCHLLLDQEYVASLPCCLKNKGQNNSALQDPVKNIAGICHGDVENKWYHASSPNASGIIKRCPWSWYYANDLDCRDLVMAFYGGSFIQSAPLIKFELCHSQDHHPPPIGHFQDIPKVSLDSGGDGSRWWG